MPDLGGEDPAKGKEGDEPHAEVLQAAHAHAVSIGADLVLGDEGGDASDDSDKADGSGRKFEHVHHLHIEEGSRDVNAKIP